MTQCYDLYGWRAYPLQEAANQLATVPGLALEKRESSYLGGLYYLGAADGVEKLILQLNFKDDEGYLQEPDFPDHHTLIYVTWSTEHSGKLLDGIPGLVLLNTEVI